MKIFKIHTTILIILLACLFLNNSCNKALDNPSKRMEAEADAWKSIDDTRSRLIGVYALFRAALANNNNYWLWGELRNGDFVATSRIDLKSVIDGDLNATYDLLENMKDWRPFYAVINAANLFIERSGEVLDNDERYTTLNHSVDVAQVRALRAWAYFMMVRIWGDVPLITNSYDGSFTTLPKTPQEKVLNFCEQDLKKAVEVLPFKYGVDGDPLLPGSYYSYGAGRYENSLINRLSAYTLLAHIAAWRGNYYDVDIYSKFVIDNRSLSNFDYVDINVLTNPTGIFYARGNYKHILAFNFVYGHGESGTSGEGHIESLTLASPLISKVKPDLFVPKKVINRVFDEQNDRRFGIDTISGLPTTAYFTNYLSEVPIFSKIKVIANGTTDGKFQIYSSAIIFSRMEEITLLRAEALAVLGKPEEAARLLNVIRANRSANLYTAASGDNLIDEIFLERRRELMGEGWRWYDIIRYNKIKQNNPEFLQLIQEGGIYYPIANDVLQNNKMLTQNTYWNK